MPTTVTLQGAVQKGPFVLGSSVAVSAVDAMGNPTGQVFNTQTKDDLGQFQLDVTYQGNVSLEGTGYYYNEASGKLSGSNLTLRAFYSVSQSGTQSAYINIITHLSYGRVRQLLVGGVDAAAAVKQAEAELRTALGIGGPAFDPKASGTEMNLLGGDSDANAYVFAVSSILAQMAQDTAGPTGSVDATLQELINTLSSTFAQNGTIDPTTVGKIKAVQAAVNPQTFMDLLAVRLTQTGSSATVPDLKRVWDTDGDGFANSIDSCPLVANPSQGMVNDVCSLTVASAPRSGTNAAPLVVADFNGDGKDDIVLVRTTGIDFYAGDGSGKLGTPIVTTLGPSDMLTPPAVLFGPMPVGVGNLNFDLKPDLIVDSGQNIDNNADTVFLPGDGAGHFGAPLHLNLTITYGTGLAPGFTHFVSADFNGDGMTDVVGGVGKGDLLYGRFSKAAPLEISQITGLPTLLVNDLAAADLNKDGHADLVVASSADATAGSSGGLFVLLSTNSATAPHFTVQPVLTAAGTHPTAVAIGDVDGDGKQDLIAADSTTQTITALMGDGAGSFANPIVATGYFAPLGLSAGDVTGDGKADLAFMYNSKAQLLISSGTAFSPAAPISIVGQQQISGLAIGPLNADLRPDLVLQSISYGMSGSTAMLSTVLVNP